MLITCFARNGDFPEGMSIFAILYRQLVEPQGYNAIRRWRCRHPTSGTHLLGWPNYLATTPSHEGESLFLQVEGEKGSATPEKWGDCGVFFRFDSPSGDASDYAQQYWDST